MEARLLRAALGRRRSMVVLAVLAVAIGASVASALLHVSGDVSRKLSSELRSLGPNLLIVPANSTDSRAPARGAATQFMDESMVRTKLRGAALDGVPLLYAVARVDGRTLPVIGADLEAAKRMHPGWTVPSGAASSLMGQRLMRRLGANPGDPITLEIGDRRVTIPAGVPLAAGGADDEAWWIPLAEVQAWTGLQGKVSLAQARVAGGADAAAEVERALERDGGVEVLTLRALSATEAGLLERMRRLMALVTAAALIAAGLAAFGTLTDLALERRRDIALMKALGARRRDVVRQFAVESFAIGLIGGIAGWLFGLFMAEIIGHQVFHSTIALRWDVPLIVLALSLAIAGLASFGPIRLALAVDPARVLKGD